MESVEYIKVRVDEQIKWYDEKSKVNQRWYHWLRAVEIIAASLVPLLAGYISNGTSYLSIIVGALGVLIAVITAIVGLFHFHEKWIEYRTVCESLKNEKNLFLTATSPYSEEKTAFQIFVQRIEALISQENSKWSQYIKPITKEKQNMNDR